MAIRLTRSVVDTKNTQPFLKHFFVCYVSLLFLLLLFFLLFFQSLGCLKQQQQQQKNNKIMLRNSPTDALKELAFSEHVLSKVWARKTAFSQQAGNYLFFFFSFYFFLFLIKQLVLISCADGANEGEADAVRGDVSVGHTLVEATDLSAVSL